MTQIQQAAEEPGMLAQMHDWLTTEASGRLAAMGGVWRDLKHIGLYRCEVA